MLTFRPYLETLKVGTIAGSQRNLIDGYRYVQYFSPVNAPLVVVGFNTNFEVINVRVQLSDTSETSTWVPFFQTPIGAVAGAFDNAEPVLLLPAPYLMPADHRVQVMIQNLSGSNISDTQLTLVAVRVDDLPMEACRVAA